MAQMTIKQAMGYAKSDGGQEAAAGLKEDCSLHSEKMIRRVQPSTLLLAKPCLQEIHPKLPERQHGAATIPSI